jgi:glutamate/tyrosine decarboxylase-like PLP-dependent enzyme
METLIESTPLITPKAPAPWEQVLQRLRTHFLQPDERNANELDGLVASILASVPGNRDEALHLGESVDYEKALQRFEVLTSSGRPRSEVLAGLGRILSGMPKWHHPQVMHNINPPPMLDAVAAASVANLYNANALWDYVSAGALYAERQITRQLAELAGWDREAGGVFTFGGKGCLTYAVRLGLNRCLRGSAKAGIATSSAGPVVISSAASHYSLDTVCSLVGLGTDASLRVAVHDDDTMDTESLEQVLTTALAQGRPVAAVVLCGGNTLHMSVDAVDDAIEVIERVCGAHGLNYRPFVYFDLVVGWPWLFFSGYDFGVNPLGFSPVTIERLRTTYRRVAQVKRVDAFGVDFHKLGHCPYSTSMFLARDETEIHSIFRAERTQTPFLSHGSNFMQHHTIEHSRSAAPVLAAWTALQVSGHDGFRAYLANGVGVADALRHGLARGGFELLNRFGNGFASVFAVRAPGRIGNFDALLEAPTDILQHHNAYTFRLAHFLEHGCAAHTSFVLRFLPQYKRASCGTDAAVLVAYPMSPSLDAAQMSVLATIICNMKRAFDELGDTAVAPTRPMPKHVPK